MRRIFISLCIMAIMIGIFMPAGEALALAEGITDVANMFNPVTLISLFFEMVGNIVLRIAGFFVWLPAVLLNLIINISVINMGSVVESMEGIETSWEVLRDVSNLIFIFVLLYVSIATILRLSGFGTMRLIRNVILVALFINFSLFFTKVIIDTSNLLALEFYQRTGIAETSFTESKFSESLMTATRISSIYSLDTSNVDASGQTFGAKMAEAITDVPRFLLITIGGAVFLLVLSFVFFAITILFAIRFALLILLMVFSPLAYLAMILPQTQVYARKWWTELFTQAFFAPLFFALMFVVLRIVQSDAFRNMGALQTEGRTFSEVFVEGGAASVSIVLNFTIVIILLLASLVIAKTLGMRGAVGAISIAQGTRAIVARNTIGRAGRFAGKAYDATAAQASRAQKKLATVTGFKQIGTGLKIADKYTGGIVSGAGKAAYQVTGGGLRRSFSALEESKFGGRKALKDIEKEASAHTAQIGIVERTLEAQEVAETMNNKKLPQADRDTARKELEKILRGFTDKEVLKLGSKNLIAMATALKDSQMDAIMKSDDFSEADKTMIQEARTKSLVDVLKAGRSADVIKAELNKLSEKTKTDIIPDLVVQYPGVVDMSAMTGSNFDAILKNNKSMTGETKSKLIEARYKRFSEAIDTGNTAEVKNVMDSLGPKDVAKLPDELKIKGEVVKHLEIRDIQAMVEDGVSRGTAASIKRLINSRTLTLTPDQQRSHMDIIDYLATAPGRGTF